jgi:hypothetical protein
MFNNDRQDSFRSSLCILRHMRQSDHSYEHKFSKYAVSKETAPEERGQEDKNRALAHSFCRRKILHNRSVSSVGKFMTSYMQSPGNINVLFMIRLDGLWKF